MNNGTRADGDTAGINLQNYKTNARSLPSSKNTIKSLKTLAVLLSAATVVALGIACTGLVIAIISYKHVPGRPSFISDMERVFNCSVYAIAESEKACFGDSSITITGQTVLPGQCVSVTESLALGVIALAQGCAVHVWAETNCSGNNRTATDSNFRMPDCVTAPGIGLTDKPSAGGFSSFQVLCGEKFTN